MDELIFLVVKVELRTTLPKTIDAIAELHQQAVFLVTDTPNVEVVTSKMIACQFNSENHGTQS
jgi:hypothetical protein